MSKKKRFARITAAMLTIALIAAMPLSVLEAAAASDNTTPIVYTDDDSFKVSEHTLGVFGALGVIGGFNDWESDIAEMTDDDGDGIYVGVIKDVPAGEYDFKVRADGAWDISWGVYEPDYDRTQNS